MKISSLYKYIWDILCPRNMIYISLGSGKLSDLDKVIKMKLSMSLIAKHLESYQPECHILKDTFSIKGVRLLSVPQSHFSLEYVYLGTAESYYQDQRYAGALLLANGENQIIFFNGEYEELLNGVLSTFDFYAEFEQQLVLVAAQNQPLQVMMQLIGSVLDCPVLVFDIDGELISNDKLEEIADQPFMSELIRSGRLDYHGIGAIVVDEKGAISHDLSDTPQYLSVKDADEMGCVAMYLKQRDERIGFIMLFAEESLQILVCLRLAPLLARCCADAAEFTEKSSLRQSSSSVFIALLNGEKLSSSVMEKFEADIQVGSNAALIVFQSLSVRNYTLHRMLMSDIKRLNTPCIACEYEERIVILTTASATDAIIRFFASRIEASNMAIGISMPFQDIGKTSIALAQAYFALGAQPDPGIRYCRDLALPYLIQTLRENERTKHLLHPALGFLEQYDAGNHTEYFQTLWVFVQVGRNQTEAANALHIHLNTLKYRLGRIRELTDVDFGNQEEMYYIWLSMKLRKEE